MTLCSDRHKTSSADTLKCSECTEGGLRLLLKRSAPVLAGSKVSVCLGPFPTRWQKIPFAQRVRIAPRAADTLIPLAAGGGSGVVGMQAFNAPKYIVSSFRTPPSSAPHHTRHPFMAFMTVCHDVAIFRCVSGCSACLDSRYPNFHGIFLAGLRRSHRVPAAARPKPLSGRSPGWLASCICIHGAFVQS